MLLLVLIMALSDPPWQTFDIQCFRPIGPLDTFVMLPDGDFVVLDIDETTITRYDPEGRVRRVLATKGNGPGEIVGAGRIELVDREIVASLGGHTYLINLKTGAIERIVLERVREKGYPHKVSKGWFLFDVDLKSEPPTEFLRLHDPEFGLKKTIYQKKLPEFWDRGRFASHLLKRTYQPERSFVRVMPGGDLVVYRHAAEARVQLIDSKTGELRHVIDIEPKPIAIDKKKAKEEIEQWKRSPQRQRLQYFIPDVFPIIESVSILAGRTIVVSQKARNEMGTSVQFFDDRGRSKDVGMWFGDFFKILGIHGDWYYVGTIDEEEDLYGIAKVHKNDFPAYLKANPIGIDKFRDPPLVVQGSDN